MLVSIPKPYEEHTDDVHIYSHSMSKHHQGQYSRVNTHCYPPQNGKVYEEPMYFSPHQEYYTDPTQSAGHFGNTGYDYNTPGEPYGGPSAHQNFSYMQSNASSSQFSHSSTLSSPHLEHQLSHSSLPGSYPSPYAKEHPDVLTAMRNRTHSWSSRGSRKSQAMYYDKWSMPYEPQMGGVNYAGTSDNDQLMSPLVGSAEDSYSNAAAAAAASAAAASAAAAAAGERMRANSHPPFYSPAMARSAVPPPLPSSLPIHPPATAMHPSLDRHSSYGSNGSDNESYSPTYAGDEGDERRTKRSATCPICNKILKRDLTRHMRTHAEVARFICPFPRSQCPHKRGQFNRPYDFKKHLLHHHFQFDKAKVVRRFRDLQSKLTCRGSCPCGQGNFTAAEWLDNHILGGNVCPLVQVDINPVLDN